MWLPLLFALVATFNSTGREPQETPGWDVAADLVREVSKPRELELGAALREARTKAYDLGEVPEELAALVGELGHHDPGVFALALQILVERRIPAQDEAPEQILSLVQEQLCLELFARGPKGRASQAIDGFWAAAREAARKEAPDGRPTRAEVEAVTLATGALGQAQELAFLMTLLPEEAAPNSPFERALTQLLKRAPDGFQRLRHHWQGLNAAQVGTCLSAVLATHDPRALYFIEDVMLWDANARLQCAGIVQSIGRSVDAKLNDSLALYLVELLESDSPTAARTAALALAQLRSIEALEPLIDALRDAQDAHLQQAIVRALRATTGLSLPAAPEVWALWLRDEHLWQASAAPRYLAQLQSSDAIQNIDGLRQLMRHPVAARKYADQVAALVDHTDLAVARLACQALAQLDVPTVVPRLIAELDRPDLHNDVEAALMRLTGWPAQPNADAWLARLALETDGLD